jgi:hypothetical protein
MSVEVTGWPWMSECLQEKIARVSGIHWATVSNQRRGNALDLVKLGQIVDVAANADPVVVGAGMIAELLFVPRLVVVGAEQAAKDDDVFRGRVRSVSLDLLWQQGHAAILRTYRR